MSVNGRGVEKYSDHFESMITSQVSEISLWLSVDFKDIYIKLQEAIEKTYSSENMQHQKNSIQWLHGIKMRYRKLKV